MQLKMLVEKVEHSLDKHSNTSSVDVTLIGEDGTSEMALTVTDPGVFELFKEGEEVDILISGGA